MAGRQYLYIFVSISVSVGCVSVSARARARVQQQQKQQLINEGKGEPSKRSAQRGKTPVNLLRVV